MQQNILTIKGRYLRVFYRDMKINRFGEKIESKPKGKKFDFNVGDVVFSATLGLCLIQGYGNDNQYWVENGRWGMSDWKTDIEKKATKRERIVFLKRYKREFIEGIMDKYFPANSKEEVWIEARKKSLKHIKWINELLKA